jgi:hypothetical protein
VERSVVLVPNLTNRGLPNEGGRVKVATPRQCATNKASRIEQVGCLGLFAPGGRQHGLCPLPPRQSEDRIDLVNREEGAAEPFAPCSPPETEPVDGHERVFRTAT